MFCDTEFCEEVIYSFSVRGQRFGFCDTEGPASEEVLGFCVTKFWSASEEVLGFCVPKSGFVL